MCSVVVIGEASGQRVPGFYSRQQHLYCRLTFECGGGRLAGRYKRRKPDRAGRYKIFLMWGGGGPAVLSVSSGTDTFESVQHHYAQEMISLSTILCVTRRTFYFFGFE
jgi:hypothetical protein